MSFDKTITIDDDYKKLLPIPDGVYAAKQSGYTVEIICSAGDKTKTIAGTASFGVRGMNCPCFVSVNNGKFEFADKPN